MDATTTAQGATFDRGGPTIWYTKEHVGYVDGETITVPSSARNVRSRIERGRLVVSYELPAGGENDATTDPANETVSYTISGATSQEPLATHRHFRTGGKWAVTDAEWKTWKKWQDAGTDLSSSEVTTYLGSASVGFNKYVTLFVQGFTDYLLPRVTVRKTIPGQGNPDLSKLGTIQDPGVEISAPSGGDFLLVGMESVPEPLTGKRTTSEEYLSSDSGGWNPDIYAD